MTTAENIVSQFNRNFGQTWVELARLGDYPRNYAANLIKKHRIKSTWFFDEQNKNLPHTIHHSGGRAFPASRPQLMAIAGDQARRGRRPHTRQPSPAPTGPGAIGGELRLMTPCNQRSMRKAPGFSAEIAWFFSTAAGRLQPHARSGASRATVRPRSTAPAELAMKPGAGVTPEVLGAALAQPEGRRTFLHGHPDEVA